jgi:hypothetical protein
MHLLYFYLQNFEKTYILHFLSSFYYTLNFFWLYSYVLQPDSHRKVKEKKKKKRVVGALLTGSMMERKNNSTGQATI